MAAQAGQEAVRGAVERTEAWCRGQGQSQGSDGGDHEVNLRETFQYYDPADSPPPADVTDQSTITTSSL